MKTLTYGVSKIETINQKGQVIETTEPIIKTFVITISRKFPSYHPLKGQFTNFNSGIVSGKKKHTIRGNYEFWKKRIDLINAGLARLSVREWIDKPYFSKQVELFNYGAGEVGIQQINLFIDTLGNNKGLGAWVAVDQEYKPIDVKQLIKNDGLEIQDFYDWFKKPLQNPCIIHFTDLRY